MSESAPSQQPALDRTSDPAYRLWRLWRQGQRPDVREFLAGHPDLSLTRCVGVLRVDQHERWQAGERVTAEEYLQSCFFLGDSAEHALDVVLSEFLLRQRLGETPNLEEYARRFPQFAEQLRLQVELHRALELSRAGASSGQGSAAFEDRQTVLRAAVGASAATTALPAVPGYEVLGMLGKGGMGVVYQARHLQLRRLVALKMLRADHAAGDEWLSRFRAESAALARLQHPNIVQIHEVGEHDGRPLLALEYVAGGSLDRKAAGTPQPAREAAQCVQTLARAVHYAHARGIVHRDLKPQNVLLTEDGTPKVTDFGLAKLLAVEAGHSSLDYQTQSGAILGTPAYMAPEQTGGKGAAVGPAADVYALGAILYDLLTGRPPHQGATVLETLEQVRSREPVPVRRLQPKVPRDLETVCLKCLRKEPPKRYASAEALAEDLGRFLDGRPIQARPTSRRERCWKWARRRPAVAALALALCVALASLLGVGIWSYAEISAALEDAEAKRIAALRASAKEAEQRREAELKGAEAQAKGLEARRQAEQARKERKRAWEVGDRFLTQISQNLLLEQPHQDGVRKALLKEAVSFYEELIREGGQGPDMQAERGRAYLRYGWLVAKSERSTRANVLFERARAIFERLAKANPAESDYRFFTALADVNLGRVFHEQHHSEKAEASLRQAVGILEGLPGPAPRAAEYQAELASALDELGAVYCAARQLPEAEKALRAALAVSGRLAESYPKNTTCASRLARAHDSLARMLQLARRIKEGETENRAAVRLYRAVTQNQKAAVSCRVELAAALVTRGNLCSSLGQPVEAERACEEARAILEPQVRAHPGVHVYLRLLGTAYQTLGQLHDNQFKKPSADKYYRAAGEIFTALERADPESLDHVVNVAYCCFGLIQLLLPEGRYEDVLLLSRQAIPRLKEVLKKTGGRRLRAKELLCQVQLRNASALAGLKRYAQALEELDRALTLAGPAERRTAEFVRTDTRARLGQHAAAAAALERLIGPKETKAFDLYLAATTYIVCARSAAEDEKLASERRKEVADGYDRRAIGLVARAHALRFFRERRLLDHLKSHPDFGPLRSRQDFQKLVQTIEREARAGG